MVRRRANFWQPHDNKCLNGRFKINLSGVKRIFFEKKRAHGLPAEVQDAEIVLVLKPAIDASFNNPTLAKKALAIRGWLPLNCATLDEPEVLMSAPTDV